jgi:hypothetical protein
MGYSAGHPEKVARQKPSCGFFQNCHKYYFAPRRMPMNPENAWNYTLDMLDDSPLGQAAAQCKPIAYNDDHRNRTFTILAPNKRIAFMVDTPSVVNNLKSFLDLIGDLELKLAVQVKNTEDGEFSEYAVFGGWAQVLETLQAESPRASFDTWMRETWPVSLSDGILTVGARNAYAAEWLINRVSERAGELASALLGEDVKVNFVVSNDCSQVDDESEDDSDDEKYKDDVPGRNDIEPAHDTAYTNEVRPDRIVIFPGYSLRMMWHGDLSPKEMSIWVAFRQAVWATSNKKGGNVRNIPYQEIVRFAMMSAPSYFREINGKESLAGGLVTEVPFEFTSGPANPHFDNARRWRVSMQPRLTRRDCNVIHTILYREISETSSMDEAMSVAVETLKNLAKLSPGDYLDDPENQKVPISGWPKGIVEIARRALDFQGDMPEDLDKAAENLQTIILGAYGQVVIPHYFLRTTAPELGFSQAQAWTIISLRDMCYYDHIDQKPYSFTVLRDGLQQLASLTGSSTKTVNRWLKDPAFLEFVTIEDTENFEFPTGWGPNCIVLDIRPTEPTAEEREVILAQLANSQDIMRTKRDKMINGSGQNDKRVGTKRSTGWDKMINGMGQNDKRLNNFIKPQLNPNKLQESPQAPRLSAQKPGRVGSRAFWDWDFLMARNAVSTPMSKKLLIANKAEKRDIVHLCQKFVSWILYGYSDAGRGLANPVSNALARLKENFYTGAGGDFDRLAALPPNTLRAYIDLDLAGRDLPDNYLADAYTFNFANLPEAAKRELRGKLFE